MLNRSTWKAPKSDLLFHYLDWYDNLSLRSGLYKVPFGGMHYPLEDRGPIVVNRDDFAAPPTRGYEPPSLFFFFFYRFGGGSMAFLRVPLLYNHWREIARIIFFLIFCFVDVWELGSELILSYFHRRYCLMKLYYDSLSHVWILTLLTWISRKCIHITDVCT